MTKKFQQQFSAPESSFQGEVETETVTEYREVTDDADFGSFGNFEAQKELAKGRLLGKLTAGDSGAKGKAASSSGMTVCTLSPYVILSA